MPRQGDGSSDNGPFEEATHNIGHGVTKDDASHQSIERRKQNNSKDKTAPLPEGIHEQGAGLKGMNASGGQSQGIKQGPDVGQGGRGGSN